MADRREIDPRPRTAPDAVLNPHLLGPDLPERRSAAPRTPGADALGAERQGRAERRREGLLPQSEDPLRRWAEDRPGGPPPGGGRRRSDGPVSDGRPPAPRPTPPVSGPMTSVASPAATAPPRASSTARPVPPRGAPAAGPGARRPGGGSTAVPPRPSGTGGWPGESGSVPDVTQRVSGSAPADSAWGAPAAEAPVVAPQSAPPRTPQLPPRAADRPAPAAPGLPPRSGRPAPDRLDADHAPRSLSGPGAERRDAAPSQRQLRDDDRTAPDPAEETMVAARRAVDVPVGGRAAARLERQAAEAAARRSAGRFTAPPAEPAGDRRRDEDLADRGAGAPRRGVQGVLAVVVIALVVLGVWSFRAPGTTEIAAQTPLTTAPATSAALPPPPLPSLAPIPSAAPVPPAPVKAPITVLNSTRITGLAATIGDQFTAGGWEVLGTGAYTGDDIAATTVYYTAGDAQQEQAATQLVEQFGADVSGPVERFFDVPGVAEPGIVVVATGNWRP